MPRIESGSSGGGSGFTVPYKLLAVLGLIACAIGYTAYQYVQLYPAPKAASRTPKPAAPADRKLAGLDKLGLTDDQKSKLQSIVAGTTDPATMRRQAVKLLTPEQKAKAKDLRAEAQTIRLKKKEEQKAKMAQLFKGNDLAVAQAGNKAIREREAARRKAAQAAASPTPTP